MNKLLYLLLLFTSIVFSQDTLQSSGSVISLDKLNILYRSVSNPIRISVPNNVYDFSISIENGSSTKIDKYRYEITPSSGKELTIYVNMILENGSTFVEEHFYKIIDLNAPLPTLNKYFSSGYSDFYFTIDELINAEVGIKFIDNFFMYGEVISFNIKIPGYPTIVVDGNIFTDEVFQLLKKARKKDEIIISEIRCKYVGLSGLVKKTPPLTFKIIK